MAIRRMSLNLHNIVSIRLERDRAEGTPTQWTSITVLDEADNEYEIACFGTPQIIDPQDELVKEPA